MVAPFKTLLNIFFNTEETILKYVEDDTCLVEVPRTCPDSLNPKKIAAKKAYDDALQTMNRANAAATRSNNHNAGRGDHHGYAGRGDNQGGRGRGTSGRGDGGGRGDTNRGDGGRGDGGCGNGGRGASGRGGGGRGQDNQQSAEER